MNNSEIKRTFDHFYDQCAPLCYGLALNKLGSEQAAQQVLEAVVRKLAVGLKEPDLKSEEFQHEVCKVTQLEITSYKKNWALSDLFSCRNMLTMHS